MNHCMWLTAHRLTADQTPHRLDAIRVRCLNYLAPGVLFGANGQPGSMAIGNILMLLMKWPTTQGVNAFSFPHLGITKVAQASRTPFRGPEARLTPVSRGILIFPKMTASRFPPEVLRQPRRYKRSETRSCQRESASIACAAGTAFRCPPANF